MINKRLSFPRIFFSSTHFSDCDRLFFRSVSRFGLKRKFCIPHDKIMLGSIPSGYFNLSERYSNDLKCLFDKGFEINSLWWNFGINLVVKSYETFKVD